MTVEIRALADFEKISIFIPELSFYIFTEEGFQNDVERSFLIG